MWLSSGHRSTETAALQLELRDGGPEEHLSSFYVMSPISSRVAQCFMEMCCLAGQRPAAPVKIINLTALLSNLTLEANTTEPVRVKLRPGAAWLARDTRLNRLHGASSGHAP